MTVPPPAAAMAAACASVRSDVVVVGVDDGETDGDVLGAALGVTLGDVVGDADGVELVPSATIGVVRLEAVGVLVAAIATVVPPSAIAAAATPAVNQMDFVFMAFSFSREPHCARQALKPA